MKFALKFITGAKKLIPKHEIIEEVQNEYIIRRNMGISNRSIQKKFSPEVYFNELIKVAEISYEKIRFDRWDL